MTIHTRKPGPSEPIDLCLCSQECGRLKCRGTEMGSQCYFDDHFRKVMGQWEVRAKEISEWCLPYELPASFALLEALSEKMWELYELSKGSGRSFDDITNRAWGIE